MGGKKSEGLGRALIRQHNQLVQQSKDKSRALRQQRRVLESVIDVSDIDAVIEKAEEAERIYAADNPSPNLLINFDSNGMTAEERRKEQEEEEALHASSLRVPRRPPWNGRMSLEELDANERQAFIEWRRNLAKLEENEKLVLTPFEKNLDIWRQLWRVVERSDLLVMVVDARDPLFYRCPDLEAYAREIDEHKKTLLLVNKADLLPLTVRQRWANYFHDLGILYLFWSAKAASASLEGKQLATRWAGDNPANDHSLTDSITKIYGRDELLARLQSEAEVIASSKRDPTDTQIMGSISSDSSSSHPPSSKQVIVGFVGYPNVGKSSTINALVGGKKTGVTSTPGKTKHFQTLIISDALMLCDCPGLVFPSFSSSRYEMIASGVLPIDRMTVHREAVQVVANKVPRHVLESVYNITLPKPKTYELQSRAPLASELLRAYSSSRGHVSSSCLPDETRAARQILKDYIDGKIPHFEMPPGSAEEELTSSSLAVDENSDACSIEEEEFKDEKPSVEQVLDELKSFDLAGGVLAKTAAGAKKKNAVASYKHHRKPQRKKDRLWRVGNDNGDGMPV